MNINIYLNKVEDKMLVELNEAEGAKLTNEEYAQRLFSSALWLMYDELYKSRKENER